MAYFLSMLVSGLKLGSIYAIVAIGYSIVYGILRLINFAHGDIMTVGVYIILVLMNRMGVPLLACVVISVGLSVLVGLLIERLAYRPLRDASEETTLISSLAVSALLQNLLQIIFSAQRQPFLLPSWLSKGHQIGPVNLSTVNIITFIVTAIFLCGPLLHSEEDQDRHGDACLLRKYAGVPIDGYQCEPCRHVLLCHRLRHGGDRRSAAGRRV